MHETMDSIINFFQLVVAEEDQCMKIAISYMSDYRTAESSLGEILLGLRDKLWELGYGNAVWCFRGSVANPKKKRG